MNVQVLPLTLCFLFLVQMAYCLIFFTILPRHKKRAHQHSEGASDCLPPISVIIVADDLFEKLEKNLPLVLQQDYPQFEVIVVYDQSSYETDVLLCDLQLQYPNLYHTFVPDQRKQLSHRKLGVSIGIKASHNDWLVFTTPSCAPASDQWLRRMARNFTNETSVVLGSAQYVGSSRIWQMFVQFDMFFKQLCLLGLAAMHRPYSAFGHNMAYHKHQFLVNGGFNHQLHIERGEDNILVNEIATPSNTCIEISPSSFVCIDIPRYKSTWHNERIYRAQSDRRLKGFGKTFLCCEVVSRLLLSCLAIAGIVWGINLHDNTMCIVSASLLVAHWVVQSVVLKINSKVLNVHVGILQIPCWNVLMPLIDMYYFMKGRRVNK
ncbi:MAG: glycosyltransferase [Bacteroidales bacterium]|nr:glycosyltransferase [Bacteroidales bacterium]